MKQRAKKQNENARCCWICGKLGGAGFTTALRNAGYEVALGEMAYAHPRCMARSLKAAKRQNWKQAALIVGENICSVGPRDYYGMNAKEWQEWALAALRDAGEQS